MALTVEAIAFTKLGRTLDGLTLFAETKQITDPRLLLQVKNILETHYSDGITSIDRAYFDGKSVKGEFSDQINSKTVKYYAFQFSPKKFEYRMLNSEQMTAFVEASDFSAISSGRKIPKCQPGNTRCGGRCIQGKAICRSTNSGQPEKETEGENKKTRGSDHPPASGKNKNNQSLPSLPIVQKKRSLVWRLINQLFKALNGKKQNKV